MNINLIGVAAAFATFFAVWLGHVSVRKIERATFNLWIPTCVAISLGIGLEVASYLTVSLTLSAICGILGLTFFWDAREFFRQQQRVQHGHAPANPNNPRHMKILADSPNAATFDWLDRDPRGSAYSSAEISSMKESAN
jgi:predicted outer membrane lipoprotein